MHVQVYIRARQIATHGAHEHVHAHAHVHAHVHAHECDTLHILCRTRIASGVPPPERRCSLLGCNDVAVKRTETTFEIKVSSAHLRPLRTLCTPYLCSSAPSAHPLHLRTPHSSTRIVRSLPLCSSRASHLQLLALRRFRARHRRMYGIPSVAQNVLPTSPPPGKGVLPQLPHRAGATDASADGNTYLVAMYGNVAIRCGRQLPQHRRRPCSRTETFRGWDCLGRAVG